MVIMMTIKTLLIAAALMVSGVAVAQDSADDATKVAAPENFSKLSLAGQLVKYGYEAESSLALIQAAQLYSEVNAGVLDAKKTSAGEAVADEVAKTDAVSFDVNKLLADATEFADGNPACLALTEELKNVGGTRGAVGGAKSTTEKVLAGDTDVYNIRFYGGETACVVVSGDGDTDLDLYVYDNNGNLIDKDIDYTDDCVVTWTPRWTGNFVIKIKNRGRVYNRYVIATN